MNYFAHARRFLDDPYFVAGTAVPDWLGVIDRKVRARSPAAQALLADPDPRVVSLAQGIVQHHFDDSWFHQSEAFVQLNARFARQLRDLLIGDASMRPGFVGHIAVELLLDACLIKEAPPQLDAYYQVLGQLDADLVEKTVNRISRVSTNRLAVLLPRFEQERFLFDYASDERLLRRLNQVMRRVGLELLPESAQSFLAEARCQVQSQSGELLAGESTQPAWQQLN